MKTKLLMTIAALVGAIMLASCIYEAPTLIEYDGEVQFTGSVETATSETRASETLWEENDEIGITMCNANPAGNIDYDFPYYVKNKRHKISDTETGRFEAVSNSEKIYYPFDDSKVYFCAYYPWDDIVTSNPNVYVLSIHQEQTKENQPELDILWAKATNLENGYGKNHNGDVDFEFKHVMCMIEINVRATNSVSTDGMVATIKNISNKGYINTLKGRVTTYTTDTFYSNITMRKWDTAKGEFAATYDAIVLPRTRDSQHLITVTFANDNDEYVWEAGDILLESGYKYVYNVTIGIKAVSVTSRIEAWGREIDIEVPAYLTSYSPTR